MTDDDIKVDFPEEEIAQIHCHSHFSLLDGLSLPDELAARAVKTNQRFLCITDHGAMGCVPSQIRAAEENGLHPIFGMEAYINPLQPLVADGESTSEHVKHMGEDDRKRMRKSNHLLILAETSQGYSNLVHLSSWAWQHGFYFKPRLNREILRKHKEGLVFTSCCYNSEIAQAFDRGGDDEGFDMIKLYVDLLGAENLYLAIMLIDFPKQRAYNQFIQRACLRFGLRPVLEQDCHYCNKEDSKWQRIMLMIQTKRTMQEIESILAKAEQEGTAADVFELQDSQLWFKSSREVDRFYVKNYQDTIDLDFYLEAKRNTVRICERCKGVTLDRSPKLPRLPNANDKLKAAMLEGFKARKLPYTQVYKDRIKEEYDLICHKDFASYFLIQKMQTDEARRWWGEQTGTDGTDAVGPGRGSGPGALTNYLLGICDVDPIDHDLLFSRFLSPARGGKTIKTRFTQPPLPTPLTEGL